MGDSFQMYQMMQIGGLTQNVTNNGNWGNHAKYPNNCERRELSSQSYGRPKKRKKILNIGRRTILYKTFSYCERSEVSVSERAEQALPD